MKKKITCKTGLKKNIIEVYLATFTEQPLSAQEIANKTNLIRQIVYDALKELISSGLVYQVYDGKTKKYEASDEKQLLNLLKSKEDFIKDVLSDFKKLRSEVNINSKNSTYYGINGLRYLFNLTLESKTPLLFIVNYNIAHEIFRDFDFYNYTLKRVENKIPLILLVNSVKLSREEKEIWSSDKKQLRETRFNPEIEKIPSTFIIFENKVIIFNMSKDNPIGLLIEDQLIKKSHEAIFYYLWEKSKS